MLIQSFLNVVYPSWRVAIPAAFIDFEDLCELNPDPPPPFDPLLLVQHSGSNGFGPMMPLPALNHWVYRWIQYQSFLTVCACQAPVMPAPAERCAYVDAQANLTVGPHFLERTYHVPDDLWASWRTKDLAGSFYVGYEAKALGTIDPTSGNASGVYIRSTTGQSIRLARIQTFGSGIQFTTRLSEGFGRMPQDGVIWLATEGDLDQITELDFCWWDTLATPAPTPLPPWTPPDNVPPAPTPLCSLDEVCKAVGELLRRLTMVSSQVSDIQAQLAAADVPHEISRQPISGEGEAMLPVGTRAISIELLQLGPEAYTSALGRPRGLMRVGSVRWGDGIGYSRRTFIDADRFDRPRPANVQSLSWQLLSGTSGVLKFLA